ncbi:globin 1 [Dermatophagoides farinae]|uniref:Cytoglobin-1-like protein n=1 Tax=Dermatophagoides farinae TaxID=6954 RepID=A0A922HUG0_DERFA|nr:cytoglobin-2-like [Dermatophagoides farinae]KAH7643587.1 cytoglobin-1-like protein [Dermatophagoides farinae]KAH9506444.1 hypothetical protein DERF_011177 [Dermatophagoides farinae]
MTLTEKDTEIIQKTWTMVRADSIQAGVDLFRKFFEANPDYVKLFPFDNHEDIEAVLKSSTLKMHAGRVMTALSSIVDNLNDPIMFEENLQKIIISHVQRNIELKQFENLKLALVQLLMDKLGTNIMDDQAKESWSKAYDVILETYKKSKQNSQSS